MLKVKLKLSAILLFVFGFAIVQAQTSVTASGGNASGTGGTASYSLGQVVYTTNSNSNGSVVQGVQQPYEISVITGLEEAKAISLEIVAYPNPATHFIKLMIKNNDANNLSYQLYDLNGSILYDDKISNSETQIIIQNLKPSAYFLNVIQGKKVVKTFKIIKH